MSKILITGGLGFIGHHLAIKLSQKGHKIAVLDNLSRPYTTTGNSLKRPDKNYNWDYLDKYYPKIEKYLKDIRNREEIVKIFQFFQPEIIIHAAGQTSAIDSIRNPRVDFENNVDGLFNILNSAKESQNATDFIYFSTNKVYGNNVGKIPLVEGKSRYIPEEKNFNGFTETLSIDHSIHTPYGISKLTGDLYVQEFGQIYNMKNTVFRLSCIYGDQQFGIHGQGFISYMFLNAISGKPIQIYGNGKQVRDLLYIDDLAILIEKYLSSTSNLNPQLFNQKSRVYNIGGGINNTISLLELVREFELILGKKLKTEFSNWRLGDQKLYISEISKIYSDIGWKPNINPELGIKKLTKWVEVNRSLFFN
nr:NAD-dependent epimerase/dehydratase family protein [Candidatus Prometheoarchaeum syntrophicum]QEE15992.1 dTDP-glucose 4,6 dehydratase [Candidatus Prometheoarchaeum syntrophicum]